MSIQKALKWRGEFYYDRKAAKKVVCFFEIELQHIEGQHSGDNFKLERWQRQMLRRIFGWKRRADGTRKHRRCLLFIPKKNGKSAIAAGLGLYLLLADDEQGSNVVSAAADTEQAELVFKFAKENVARNPKLRRIVGRTFRRSIVVYDTASSYRVLSSAANTKHGPNLHAVLIDELHALPNRELVDTLVAGVVSRRQPLVMYMTTAGHDQNSICGEVYHYFKKVKDGIIDDPEALPIMFEPDKGDDWRDRKTWYKANPNLGITIQESVMAADCKRAQDQPSEENKFKRLHLNIWTQSDVRWLPMDKWKLCGEPFPSLNPKAEEGALFNVSELIGKPCYGGLDLASRLDIAALALIFQLNPQRYFALLRFWVPMDTALERQLKGQAPYHDWIRDGFMIGTPGNDIDYDFIETDMVNLGKLYKIREVGYDPWNANQLTHKLNDHHGIKMVPMRQGYGTLSAPCKELETLVTGVKIHHENNPVLNWMASNVCIAEDPAGNIKPNKSKNRNLKIDGIVAKVMGLGRLMVDDKNRSSVYDIREVRTLG